MVVVALHVRIILTAINLSVVFCVHEYELHFVDKCKVHNIFFRNASWEFPSALRNSAQCLATHVIEYREADNRFSNEANK